MLRHALRVMLAATLLLCVRPVLAAAPERPAGPSVTPLDLALTKLAPEGQEEQTLATNAYWDAVGGVSTLIVGTREHDTAAMANAARDYANEVAVFRSLTPQQIAALGNGYPVTREAFSDQQWAGFERTLLARGDGFARPTAINPRPIDKMPYLVVKAIPVLRFWDGPRCRLDAYLSTYGGATAGTYFASDGISKPEVWDPATLDTDTDAPPADANQKPEPAAPATAAPVDRTSWLTPWVKAEPFHCDADSEFTVGQIVAQVSRPDAQIIMPTRWDTDRSQTKNWRVSLSAGDYPPAALLRAVADVYSLELAIVETAPGQRALTVERRVLYSAAQRVAFHEKYALQRLVAEPVDAIAATMRYTGIGLPWSWYLRHVRTPYAALDDESKSFVAQLWYAEHVALRSKGLTSNGRPTLVQELWAFCYSPLDQRLALTPKQFAAIQAMLESYTIECVPIVTIARAKYVEDRDFRMSYDIKTKKGADADAVARTKRPPKLVLTYDALGQHWWDLGSFNDEAAPTAVLDLEKRMAEERQQQQQQPPQQ